MLDPSSRVSVAAGLGCKPINYISNNFFNAAGGGASRYYPKATKV
jgi:hypothetical protein